MRKTNGFSKKTRCMPVWVRSRSYYCNFVRRHGLLSGCTPAIAIGLERTFLSFEYLVELINARTANGLANDP